MELEINTLRAAIIDYKETKIGCFAFYEGTLCGTEAARCTIDHKCWKGAF